MMLDKQLAEPKHLTLKAAVALAKEIVDTVPEDYRYTEDPKTQETRNRYSQSSNTTTCFYRHFDGTPGCLIGHMADRLNPGVFIEERVGPEMAIRAAGYEATRAANGFMTVVQREQDGGSTWQQALSKGMDEYKHMTDQSGG